MEDTTKAEMMTPSDEAYKGSGTTEFVIGFSLTLVGFCLLAYACNAIVTDGPYVGLAWLFGLTLGVPGLFISGSGMRKQRIAAELEQQKDSHRTCGRKPPPVDRR